ncbi:ARL14 effector protein-like [Octopus vulgaris]|uniref:ARL14 effector protein-like n=2 Tax=Octopus TaxID=6643 RepID=A0AA36B9X5_OCTVU|nr:ARL14 effector protein [Octopus sinensis]CAI9730123.1 ARL14 effector protein-like [Octopus vulgaris]
MLEDEEQTTTMDKTNNTSKSSNDDSVPVSPKSDYSNSNDIDKQCQTEENTLSVSSDSSIASVKVTPPKKTGRQLTKVQEMDRELTGWINGIHADGKLNELTREMIIEKGRLIAKMKKILDFAGTTNWYTRFLRRNFSETDVGKHLKMLSPINSVKFMEDFDPEKSSREMRKMNRRIYRENMKTNQMYDETGRLLDNSKDVCDCLDEDCPGCHFPCNKCGSEKCGTECRCNRKWVYEVVEIEGSNLVIRNVSVA